MRSLGWVGGLKRPTATLAKRISLLSAAIPINYLLEFGRCFFIDHFVSLVEIWCSEKLVSRFGFRVGETSRAFFDQSDGVALTRAADAVQEASGLPAGGEAHEPPDNTQCSKGVADENVLPTD